MERVLSEPGEIKRLRLMANSPVYGFDVPDFLHESLVGSQMTSKACLALQAVQFRVRILPTVFLQHKADDWVLMSCDMQDAFLTVQQRETYSW